MGKGGKELTVGHQYMMGQHIVLCQSSIDAVTELEYGDRVAWKGYVIDDGIAIDKPDLFGGKKREGGISGFINVMGGGPTQGQNDYLAAKLDGLVPNFRGVVSLVFRQVYFGNNPYIKPLRVKAQNIYSTFQSWLPQFASLNVSLSVQNTAIYIAVDNSVENSTELSPGWKDTQYDGVKRMLEMLPVNNNTPVKIVVYDDFIRGHQTWMDWTPESLVAAKSFLDTMKAGSARRATRFDLGVSLAQDFFASAEAANTAADDSIVPFKRALIGAAGAVVGSLAGQVGKMLAREPLARVVIMTTYNETDEFTNATGAAATLSQIGDVTTVGVLVGEADTDAVEAVSTFPPLRVENGNITGVAIAASARLCGDRDLNAAHILRDLLISPTSNGSGDVAEIDDASFEEAARTFAQEGMGLTLNWSNGGDVDEFKKTIEAHAACTCFQDRQTGLWKVKLIRPDYDLSDLFTVTADMVVEWTAPPERIDQAELPNQITLVYKRRDNGQDTSVTLTNVAGVQVRGSVKSEKVTMEGITSPELAGIVCQRELVARTSSIARGSVRVAYLPPALNIGSAFIINDPRVKLDGVVCRIMEIEETDGKDNSILVRFIEDAFGQDMTDAAFSGADTVAPATDRPLPSPLRFAEELPFYELARIYGDIDVAAILADDPDAGLWGATCTQPDPRHLEAFIARDDAGTLINVGSTSFAAAWSINEALAADPTVTTFTAPTNGLESELAVNELLRVNGEIMRLDSVEIDAGVATFTVGRGVLDTIPQAHAIADVAYAWQESYTSDFVQYTDGETVSLKILPSTRSEVLPTSQTPTDSVLFDSRAIRPYPAGNLQIDASYAPDQQLMTAIAATWAHRDRTIQTTAIPAAYDAGNIGPEAGVVYTAALQYLAYKADFFAASDFFDQGDFFIDPAPLYSPPIALAGTQDTSVTFDVPIPDFFAAADFFAPDDFFANDIVDRVYGFKFVLTATRDGYANRTSPSVAFATLLAPTNFAGSI